MKLIKGFLFAITGLCIMITLISLLIPSRVMVARGVEINAPKEKIFDAISRLPNWKYWQPLFKSDSVQISYNADSTVAEWESNGHHTKFMIDSLRENVVYITLQRKGENNIKNMLLLLPLENRANGVQVEWRAMTTLKWYPWEKFYGIFIDKVAGPSYEDALNSLKKYTEQ